jgi:hypothetical protein
MSVVRKVTQFGSGFVENVPDCDWKEQVKRAPVDSQGSKLAVLRNQTIQHRLRGVGYEKPGVER